MRILVIEDNRQTIDLLKAGLRQAGHAVQTALNGEDGLSMATHEPFDALVLDLMLPGVDGLEVLSRLRNSNSTAKSLPVIILSARGAPIDRVKGLDLGADDYLPKPFLMDELLARLNAIYRRRNSITTDSVITVGSLKIDLPGRRVYCGGVLLNLTALEHKLLECLMRNRGRIMTRSLLLSNVWGYDFEPRTNVIEACICRIREKLGDCGKLIRNVKGLGYVVD